VIMARAACRAGHDTDPTEVDPKTFTIGGQPPGGQRPGAGREATIAQAAAMLQGLWHADRCDAARPVARIARAAAPAPTTLLHPRIST
jgi:hypothetical protein